jgi:FG-GAP-like repeat/FG-GAP repeat
MRYVWLRCLPLLVLLPLPAALGQKATSATTLNSSSSSLQLPGSLTLTATVAPPEATAGMPSGSVVFLNNGTHSLGTGTLKAISATQNFSAPAIDGSFGYLPYGLFALPSGTGNYSVLGVLDYVVPNPTTGITNPQLTIYSGQGAALFQTSTPYELTNSNITGTYPGIDALGVGDFNHDGIPDVLIHGLNTSETSYGNEYYVLPGKAGAVFDPANSVLSPDTSGITCDCSNPTEAVAVDDFNGDGYADIAYTATQYGLDGTSGLTGVAINAGAAGPGSFTAFVTLPAITPTVTGEAFVSAGIASGHFTSSGRPDIAIVGTSSTGTTGYVAVYLNQGIVNGTISFAAPVLFNVGSQPSSIATADFRANGMTDVVVTNLVPASQAGSVQVLFGDGTGNLTSSSTVAIAAELASVSVADFNNDGYPDILAVSYSGALFLLLNDGTGHFSTAVSIAAGVGNSLTAIGDFNGDGLADITALTTSDDSGEGTTSAATEFLNSASSQATLVTAAQTLPAGTDTLTAEFPGDNNFNTSTSTGVPVAVTQTPSTLTWAQPAAIVYGTALGGTQLDAAASVAGSITYSPAAGTVLHVGATTVTATFIPTDAFDYAGATATRTITVTQSPTTLAWAQPAAMEYGTPLSAAQLNATSSVAGAITYAPAAGIVLPPGPTSVTATFVPTDTLDYAGVTASETITVNAPTLAGISPSSGKLGDPATTIAINGQGLVQGAVVEWNATALGTTWVSLNQLTAVIPASLLATTGTGTITVVDPNGIAVAGSQTFIVTASSATASATAQATVEAGQDDSVTLTVSPYPAPITATLTMQFTPTPPNTVIDPTVLFPNNTTTDVIQIPANSNAPIPAIDFATGSTAGTITLTITLTASGVDITPANLAPVTVVVPAAPPVMNSVTLDRSGDNITVSILGLSSTREVTQAVFHFTPASGASLSTNDLTVDLTGAFSAWYQSTASDSFGTTFLYTQPFTLSSDAASVGSVTVTLTNSQGASQPGTAQ